MFKNLALIGAIILAPVMGSAQGASVAFGDTSINPNDPVEITADSLSVDQTNGTAVFAGNVVAGQGVLRLSAGEVRVQYAVKDGVNTGEIDKLFATDGVILVNGPESAEASSAIYSVATGQIEMTGDVLLTQGASALFGEKLIVDLRAGTGQMVGRVKTVFQTGGNN